MVSFQKLQQKNRPKVLIVSDKEHYCVDDRYWSYGGTPKEFNALSTIFDLEIMVPVWEKSEIPQGYEVVNRDVTVHRFPPFHYHGGLPALINMFRSVQRTRLLCLKHQYDVVVAKGPREMGMAAVWGAHRVGKKSVLHYSYDWVPKLGETQISGILGFLLTPYHAGIWHFRRYFIKRVAAKASLVATVSDDFRLQLAEICKTKENSIQLLRTTFTVNELYFDLPPLARVSQSTEENIIFIGRLDSNKNVITLIRAIAILKKSGCNVFLTVVGQGPEKGRLEAAVRDLDLQDTVIFKGYVNNTMLPELLNNSCMLVLPSYSEGFPKAVMEGLAAARPVIASNVGGIPQLIKNGESGYLFNPNNIEELATRIYDILQDRDKARDMGLRGRELVKQYNAEIAKKYWFDAITSL